MTVCWKERLRRACSVRSRSLTLDSSEATIESKVRANSLNSPFSPAKVARVERSPRARFRAARKRLRTWRRIKRSPPNHAAARASRPTAKPVQGKAVPFLLARRYITAQPGATARKTVPTNLARKLENRKLEKLVIGDSGNRTLFKIAIRMPRKLENQV